MMQMLVVTLAVVKMTQVDTPENGIVNKEPVESAPENEVEPGEVDTSLLASQNLGLDLAVELWGKFTEDPFF